MSRGMVDSDRIVALLLQDAIPTLGERARAEADLLVANYKDLARHWMKAGRSLAEVQRSFEGAVVEGLQQTAHDLFWDTTWPTCFVHRRHPLWYDANRQAWCCAEDRSLVVPLGELTRYRSSGDRR